MHIKHVIVGIECLLEQGIERAPFLIAGPSGDTTDKETGKCLIRWCTAITLDTSPPPLFSLGRYLLDDWDVVYILAIRIMYVLDLMLPRIKPRIEELRFSIMQCDDTFCSLMQ